MRFQQLKPGDELKYGDIMLFKPISFRGRMIRFFERLHFGSKYAIYSHGALFWKYEGNIQLFIEAETGSGVDIKKVDPTFGNIDVYRPIDLQCVTEFTALNLLDKGYDDWEIVNIVLYYLFKKPFKKDGEQKMICTELINYCYLNVLADVGYATPASIYKIISDNIYE